MSNKKYQIRKVYVFDKCVETFPVDLCVKAIYDRKPDCYRICEVLHNGVLEPLCDFRDIEEAEIGYNLLISKNFSIY